MLTLAVFISGGGTNLQAILNAIDAGVLDARVALVVSSNPDAYGLERAKAAGIPTLALSKEDYADPQAADARIVAALKSDGSAEPAIDYIVMAGYMRKVCEPLLAAYPNRIINIHPSLLPSFAGAHGIADAFSYGVKLTGVTVHFANEDYDKGAIIAQQSVVVAEDDTLESLEEKIHEVEYVLYPQVLQLLAEERIILADTGRVDIY